MGENQNKAYRVVVEYIKSMLLSKEWRVGEKLPPERELSEKLNVSRNSVREAIRMMENMGIITSVQGSGNYVSNNFESNLIEMLSMMFLLNDVTHLQLSQLRRAIEEQAGMLAINNVSKEQIEELRVLAVKLQSTEDEIKNVSYDKKFHALIAKYSGNDLILTILQALEGTTDNFIEEMRLKVLQTEDSKKELAKSHKIIFEGIEKRDKTLLLLGMEKHFNLLDENIERDRFRKPC